MQALCSGINICMGQVNTHRWMDDRDMQAKSKEKERIQNICASGKKDGKHFCVLTNRLVFILR